MKFIVIYDSNFGNTEKVAEAVAKELKADLFSIKKANANLETAELIVVGSPINAWNPTQSMKDFLKEVKLRAGVKAAAFDTRFNVFYSGNAAKKIASQLEKKGAVIITKPIGFYVKGQNGPLTEGELERAKQWAQSLIQINVNA